MYNPFEKEQALFIVLQNEAGQYSLWPAYIEVPGGWEVKVPPTTKALCEQYVEAHWTQLSPE